MVEPIIQRLPDTTLAFARKYETLDPVLSGLPDSVYRSLIALDLERVRRGAQPLSVRETASALRAMAGEQTAQKEPSLLGAITSDIRMIGSGIGRMLIPTSENILYQEFKRAIDPEARREFARQLQGASGMERVGLLASQPGFNLLPGSFVAEAIGTGHPELLRQHPVVAALDVLPFAQGLVGRAAKAGVLGERVAAAARATPPHRPVTLTRVVGAAAEPVTARIREFLGPTRIGQAFERSFGFRDVYRKGREMDQRALDELRRIHEGLVTTAKRWESRGIDQARAARLMAIAERGDVAEIARLPQVERDFIRWLDEQGREAVKPGLRAGQVIEHKGELFSATDRDARRARSLTRRLLSQKYQESLDERARRIRQMQEAVTPGDDPRTLAANAFERLEPGNYQQARAVLHTIEQAGGDTRFAYDALLAWKEKPTEANWGAFLAQLFRISAEEPRVPLTHDQILGMLDETVLTDRGLPGPDELLDRARQIPESGITPTLAARVRRRADAVSRTVVPLKQLRGLLDELEAAEPEFGPMIAQVREVLDEYQRVGARSFKQHRDELIREIELLSGEHSAASILDRLYRSAARSVADGIAVDRRARKSAWVRRVLDAAEDAGLADASKPLLRAVREYERARAERAPIEQLDALWREVANRYAEFGPIMNRTVGDALDMSSALLDISRVRSRAGMIDALNKLKEYGRVTGSEALDAFADRWIRVLSGEKGETWGKVARAMDVLADETVRRVAETSPRREALKVAKQVQKAWDKALRVEKAKIETALSQQRYGNARDAVVRARRALEGVVDTPWGEQATILIGRLDDMEHAIRRLEVIKETGRSAKAVSSKIKTLRESLSRVQRQKEQLQKELAETERKLIPARWSPTLQEMFRTQLADEIRTGQFDQRVLAAQIGAAERALKRGDLDLAESLAGQDLRIIDRDQAIREVEAGMIANLPNARRLEELGVFRGIEAEVTETFRRMREELGPKLKDYRDPVFVHHVAAGRQVEIEYPRAHVTERSPTQVRPREVVNLTPWVNNPFVALSHQQMEWVVDRLTREWIDYVRATHVKTLDELQALDSPLRRQAEREARRTGLSVEYHFNDLLSKHYQKWEPETIFPVRPGRMGGATFTKAEYIPKTLADNLQKIRTSPNNLASATLDAAHGVFRVSVLGLSPRWLIYNAVSGLIMTAARTSPLAIVKYFEQARKLVFEGGLDPAISRGLGVQPREVVSWNYELGTRLGEMTSKLAQVEPLQKVARGAQRVLEASYRANGMLDDMYRAISYLYEKDKAKAAGLSEAEARRLGVELANKILQDWNSLTPFERMGMRYIFPFYGWMAHILRYVMTYPFDHPWRAAIVANLVEAEHRDWESGLPEQFFDLFSVSAPDAFGRERLASLRGFNPFSDVADFTTLAGFFSQTSPLVQAALETAGVSGISGRAELFPSITYDPVSGRLISAGRPPLQTFVRNLVPQAGVLMDLAGLDPAMTRLRAESPEAFSARIYSGLGLPSIPRTYNLPAERAKAQIAREEAMRAAFNEALRTGDFSQAVRYPELRPILEALRAADEAGMLEQFRPPQLSELLKAAG